MEPERGPLKLQIAAAARVLLGRWRRRLGARAALRGEEAGQALRLPLRLRKTHRPGEESAAARALFSVSSKTQLRPAGSSSHFRVVVRQHAGRVQNKC